MTQLQACKEAAHRYVGRGWSVLPLRPASKLPLMRWEIFQSQRAGAVEIDQWFERWPDANIGIVTGRISGLVVLDVDPKHGGDDSLVHIEERHGPLPHSPEVLTGGGGRHVYFRHPGGVVRNRVGIAQGIDLRADGGYVVAPPSRHPSGRDYVWEVAHHPDDTVLAELPAWVLADERAADGPGHTMAYWRDLVRSGVEEGRRNSTIASLTGHLLWHGVDPDVTRELMLGWNHWRCRPPLSDVEVTRVVDSITRLRRRH